VQTPGEEIRKQLKERNWTQSDLARIIERPLQTINAIIKGKKSITPEMAVSLGAAFGTEPEKWMRLESKYRLSLAKTNPETIEQRARLYDYAPIKEMERRGWIPRSVKQHFFCKFFFLLNQQIRFRSPFPRSYPNIFCRQPSPR